MFEKAARQKVRFNYKGLATIEDLWDINLSELDSIYKDLVREKKSQEEESLLAEQTKSDKLLALKIDLVKHVVETRLTEQKERESLVEKAERKQKILTIMAEKQDENLRNMSAEDLQRIIDAD